MIYELSIIHKSQIINQNSFLFQFTIIDHMFGFTHTPLDAARLDNPYPCLDEGSIPSRSTQEI